MHRGYRLATPRGFTSRTGPACGLVAKANRKTQAHFRCIGCGLAGPAGSIAAQNIRALGPGALGRAAVMRPHAAYLFRHDPAQDRPGVAASCSV